MDAIIVLRSIVVDSHPPVGGPTTKHGRTATPGGGARKARPNAPRFPQARVKLLQNEGAVLKRELATPAASENGWLTVRGFGWYLSVQILRGNNGRRPTSVETEILKDLRQKFMDLEHGPSRDPEAHGDGHPLIAPLVKLVDATRCISDAGEARNLTRRSLIL